MEPLDRLELEVKQNVRNGLWKCVDSLFIVRAEGFVYVSVAVCCNVTLCCVHVQRALYTSVCRCTVT